MALKRCLFLIVTFLKDKISNSVPAGTTKHANHPDLKNQNLGLRNIKGKQ